MSGDFQNELNERVHDLVQKAADTAQKPIFRVSERFAAFLEETGEEWSDSELLDWFVWGVIRSRDGVLRLGDLFPQNSVNEFLSECV